MTAREIVLSGNFSCVTGEIEDREALTLEYWDIVLDQSEDYAMIIIFLVILFTGVPLNAIIISRILIKTLYMLPPYLLLLNLAICDLLICLVPILFNVIQEFRGTRSFGSSDYARCQTCKVAVSFLMLNFQTIFNLMLISIDRFIYLKYSIKYSRYITTKTIPIALVGSWVLSFILIIPPLAGYGDLVLSASCGEVFILGQTHQTRSVPYIAVAVVIHSLILGVIIICNVWIVSIGLQQIKKVKVVKPSLTTSESEDQYAQHKLETVRDKEVAKKQARLLYTFGAILIVHFLTLVPAVVLVAVIAFAVTVPSAVYVVVLFSITSQVTLHPLVEALSLPELRKLLIMCKGVCPKRGLNLKISSNPTVWPN